MNAPAISEDSLQIQVVEWCQLQRGRMRHILHIPNQGKRSPRQGAQFKRMGMRPGVSDLLLPYMGWGFLGFWLELKVGYRQPTRAQVDFAAEMMDLGYAWGWANTFDQAITAIGAYSNEAFHAIGSGRPVSILDPEKLGFFCAPKKETFSALTARVYTREPIHKSAPRVRQAKHPKIAAF